MSNSIPVVAFDQLSHDPSIKVGSERWYEWLSNPATKSFRYESDEVNYTASKRPNSPYWNAFKKSNGKLKREYLGKSSDITLEKLQEISKLFSLPDMTYYRLKYPRPDTLNNNSYTENECVTEQTNNDHNLEAELSELQAFKQNVIELVDRWQAGSDSSKPDAARWDKARKMLAELHKILDV